MQAAAVIPARYASTRCTGTPLALLAGKPLLQRVWEAAQATGLFSEVIIATDSPLILQAVEAFGGQAVMTRSDHPSGTDRVAEAAAKLDCEIIVNVQGDEPLIGKKELAALLELFSDPQTRLASLMTPLTEPGQLSDPNTVKVVTDARGNALYFSRSAIPYNRDDSPGVLHWRHIGVYAYRRETLLRFVSLAPSPLELAEKLEQLRALENGIPIRMVPTDYQGIGVDTPADLLRLERFFNKEGR